MADKRLPEDGTYVEAMTYESIEYDRPARRVVGELMTRYVPVFSYTQCWVDGEQVDPESVKPISGAKGKKRKGRRG